MNMIRSTLLICLTIMICAGMTILYHYHIDRYTIIGTGKQAFILDRKNGVLTYCDGIECSLLPFQQSEALMGATNETAAKGIHPACLEGGRLNPGVNKHAVPQALHVVGQPLKIGGLHHAKAEGDEGDEEDLEDESSSGHVQADDETEE